MIGYGIVVRIEDGEINDVKLKRINQQISGARRITVDRFTSPGEDASPLVGDVTVSIPVQRSGGGASAAYLDVKNEPKAAPGERRTYARNADGEVVSEIWQRNNGNIDIILEDDIGATFFKNGRYLFRNRNCTLDVAVSGQYTFSNGSATVTVAEDGGMTLRNGNVTFTLPTEGNATCNVPIEAPDFIIGDLRLKDHGHGGVSTGMAETQGPKNV